MYSYGVFVRLPRTSLVIRTQSLKCVCTISTRYAYIISYLSSYKSHINGDHGLQRGELTLMCKMFQFGSHV
jgi:hypothetical protein